MKFPEKYKVLIKNSFSKDEYAVVPIRYDDRYDIMQWRNTQQYHLRQNELLNKEKQDAYFESVVAKLFKQDKPNQLLFSYLKNEECIGYGGLVHINWVDKNAEISFIMKTELEQEEFKEHWSAFLNLIEQVAFQELSLHKIFTYAFDLRPQLYEAIEERGFKKEAVLKEHCVFDTRFLDVIIHSKMNLIITLREINESDKKKTYQWANDPLTRNNSFSSKPINFEDHSVWFNKKINDQNAYYLIGEVNDKKMGLVRFDYDTGYEAYIIGVTIDEGFRGKRLSSLFLKESCKRLLKNKKENIIAFIKEENISSRKAFERAGFKLQEEEIINGNKSFRYIYGN